MWIIATLSAAFFQTLRFMLQKHLSTAGLSAGGSTFARFVFAAPVVVILLAFYLPGRGVALPHIGGSFLPYAVAGGAAQILATVCVVILFSHRNFAVGITFKKTEVIQTALAGFLILGEGIAVAGLFAILIGLIGVLVLSDMPALKGGLLRRMGNRATALGLLSGAFFAISAVCYRGASLEVGSPDPLLRAGITLCAVLLFQVVALGAYLRGFERGEITRVIYSWRVAGWVGLTSMAGSMSWFTAVTLMNAAYVNALGQIELIFAILASVLFFKERITAREGIGIALISLSVLVLIAVL